MLQRGALIRDRFDRLGAATSAAPVTRQLKLLVRKAGLTKTGGLAVLGAVIPWILARVVAGTTMYLFAYGTVALVLAARAAAPRRPSLEATRAGLFPRATEGERLNVKLEVTPTRSMTAFQFCEQVPESLGLAQRIPVARARAGQTFVHEYSLRCAKRGRYEIGPLVAITSDPIGVSQHETVICEPFELIVHPRTYLAADRPLTRLFEDPPVRPPVSRPWPAGMEFFGMREYRPGDDLRRIVWRASAKTSKLIVSEAEQGVTDHITILLDTDRGSHSRDGIESESFEEAVRAAASIGVAQLSAGYQVRVDTNGGPLTSELATDRNRIQLLDALAGAQMSRVPLLVELDRIAKGRRDTHLTVITPRLRPEDAGTLKRIRDRGTSVTVVALVWNEDHADTPQRAATVGCRVAAVHPGDDLSEALASELRVGAHL